MRKQRVYVHAAPRPGKQRHPIGISTGSEPERCRIGAHHDCAVFMDLGFEAFERFDDPAGDPKVNLPSIVNHDTAHLAFHRLTHGRPHPCSVDIWSSEPKSSGLPNTFRH